MALNADVRRLLTKIFALTYYLWYIYHLWYVAGSGASAGRSPAGETPPRRPEAVREMEGYCDYIRAAGIAPDQGIPGRGFTR